MTAPFPPAPTQADAVQPPARGVADIEKTERRVFLLAAAICAITRPLAMARSPWGWDGWGAPPRDPGRWNDWRDRTYDGRDRAYEGRERDLGRNDGTRSSPNERRSPFFNFFQPY